MSDTPRTNALKLRHEQAWANSKLGIKDLPESLDPWNIARDMERLFNAEKANCDFLAERIATLTAELARVSAELAAANAEVERRTGIGAELIIARRERDAALKPKPLTAWMDNVLAARLGAVALKAGERTDGLAEHIDFGLRLRRLLEEAGFELRAIAAREG